MPTKDGRHAYTDEERAEIIAHVFVNVACGRPVTRVFKEDDMTENGILLPSEKQFWHWMLIDDNNDGELGKKLAQAREHGIEALLDKAIHMAEQPMAGEEVTIERDPEHQKDLDDGAKITDTSGTPYEGMIIKVKKGDMVAHRKLYIETMFKAAQMLKPKKYGAKLDLTSDGKQIGIADAIAAGRKRVQEMYDKGEDK
jgi:hypothetical protein